MTILETVTGITLLFIGLIASVAFYHQIDCYHELTVEAIELRLAPLEHNDSKILTSNMKCSAVVRRKEHQVYVHYKKNHHYQLSVQLQGKL
jgi:hypothetical protein